MFDNNTFPMKIVIGLIAFSWGALFSVIIAGL